MLSIKINLVSLHMLLYVVYTCQKSVNFIKAFPCYKLKCKLALFNLAHPVYGHVLHWSMLVTVSLFVRHSLIVCQLLGFVLFCILYCFTQKT